MTYVMSDLHGYPLRKFKELLERVNFSKDDTLYIGGDAIDRGNEGIALLQYIMEQENIVFFPGNHEEFMLDAEPLFWEITEHSVKNFSVAPMFAYYDWLENGGEITISHIKKMSTEDRDKLYGYLHSCPRCATFSVNGKDYIFAHTVPENFSSDKPLDEYTDEELLWSRPFDEEPEDIFDEVGIRLKERMGYEFTFTVPLEENSAELSKEFQRKEAFQEYTGKHLIIGHTPTFTVSSNYRGKPIFGKNWVNIDVGVSGGYSPLLLRVDDMKEFYGY